MDQRQWDPLGQFERSVFLFIKLGGHGPDGQHLSRRVDYLRMSPEAMKETLQSFENIHLFPLLNERIHNSGEDADAFLEFLQRDIKLGIGDCLERFRSVFRRQVSMFHAHCSNKKGITDKANAGLDPLMQNVQEVQSPSCVRLDELNAANPTGS